MSLIQGLPLPIALITLLKMKSEKKLSLTILFSTIPEKNAGFPSSKTCINFWLKRRFTFSLR